MAEVIKCPNCGASDAEKKSETEYACNYCDSQFTIGKSHKSTSVDDILNQLHQVRSRVATPTPAKPARMIGLMIAISVMGAIIGVSFFLANGVNSDSESSPGKVAADDYWNEGNAHKFYIFEGEKGAMCWLLINQSSKHLDSSKYTLQLVDPVKNELVKEHHFISMTWNESFNFGNCLSEMLVSNSKVYFLSDANGLSIYDLYTGKLLTSNDQFASRFPELKNGIVSAKNIYYKKAIELLTKDGFKYYYVPDYDRLTSEKEFNDYQKGQALIGGFVVSGEPRQKLYYIISKQDTLRNDFSFSEYYLDEYLRKGRSNGKGEKGFAVDTSQTFFNVNFLYRNKEQVVFAFTENVAKDSKAYIISYSKDNFDKYLWKIDFNSIAGFEKAMKEGYYLRTNYSLKELAIWYESASKIGFGLDLKTGKINWNYSLK